MALTRNYKEGAIIYFAGDRGEDIYILKSGLITLSYKNMDNNNISVEKLKEGDFFGVKSALGHFPREETATAKNNSTVLVLKSQEFEELAKKNINIIIKMLKIFSTQLRKVGKKAALLMSKSGKEDSSAYSLFKLGEYYLKTKKFDQALYALHKYLEHFPKEQNVYEARKYIEMAKREEAMPSDEHHSTSEDEGDDGKSTRDFYNKASSFMNEGAFDKALSQFDKFEELASEEDNEKLSEKVSFSKGVCYFKLNKYEDSIFNFTNFIKGYPRTPYMKQTLFYIGLSYKEMDNNDKAISFFKKIASMSPEDKLSKQAASILNDLTTT